GFIGCEVAAIARTLGVPVTLYEALPQPLLRVLGPELGGWLAGVHREHGVDLRTGVSGAPEPGHATLVAVGSQPNPELSAGAGLPWDEMVVRGRFGVPSFTVFYLEAGRLRAAAGVNDGRTVSRARRLLGAGTDVPGKLLRQALADPSRDLRTLTRQP